MRKPFSEELIKNAIIDESMIFLTGDLGFMALESLRDQMGARFINAGISEQNMMSVAAAMAREGFSPWVYSIAPFCYARPFEQIRNDISFHNLPVKLVGNGGGYGYGVMGPSHHAIEDYGVMLTLPNMRIFVPVFDSDIAHVVRKANASSSPAYIRLGRDEAPPQRGFQDYGACRKLLEGEQALLLAVGPLAGYYMAHFERLSAGARPALWAIAEMPLPVPELPEELSDGIRRGQHLIIAEEHVAQGSFASMLLLQLAMAGIFPTRFHHLCAKAHIYDRYGSQEWLRCKSKIDIGTLLEVLQ